MDVGSRCAMTYHLMSAPGLLACLVCGGMLGHAGGALARIPPGPHSAPAVEAAEAGPRPAPSHRAVPATIRFLPPALHSRVTYAAGSARRAAAGNGSPSAPRSPRTTTGARAPKPVVAVADTGTGQTGYVHYFVIEGPDGERETQIGIELEDGRIAWSFPELGVTVSPFIKSGQLEANGKRYAVQHRYGLRPFADDKAMAALRGNLWARVVPWVEDETPYCNLMTRSDRVCLSCLGFVMRILYPARAGSFLSLPADFRGASSSFYITTEDLLLYQTGLQGIASHQARLRRIARLNVPAELREDLIELVTTADAEEKAAADSAPAPSAKSRSQAQRGPSRQYPQKKL
jgi:hypothetical protein